MNPQNQKRTNRLLLKANNVILVLLLAALSSGCRKKFFSSDIQDCDNTANYYEDGEHFIRRDMVTDDGVIDRQKMFDELRTGNVDCHPVKKRKYRLPID